ncbi:hypothetical protein KM043_009541 [Ampulex compressa]|nr:hypothetical protein KM043_009541 [Ampulex compressa]
MPPPSEQLKMMTEMNSIERPLSKDAPAVNNNDEIYMVCTRRMLGLPIFESVTSTISGAYAAVKDSHESIDTALTVVEDRLNDGIKYASPVTEKIVVALEIPLKGIDNAICVGLDFIEEQIPSLKLLSCRIYNNVSEYFRHSIAPMIAAFMSLANLKQLDQTTVKDQTNVDDTNDSKAKRS